MDQSQSINDKATKNNASTKAEVNKTSLPTAPPKRGLTLEFIVGLFTIVSILAIGWLAVGLGELKIFNHDQYIIYAEFDNISGLKAGASVEVAGVPIGEVSKISLKDPAATVELRIKNGIVIHDDDIASIRTKGIIGDRYVKISRGASSDLITAGKTLTETEGVVDLEDIIGKFIHNMGGDDEKNKDK